MSFGRPWARTLNSPNWPTGIEPPLQSISDTVEVNVPSSVVMGLGSTVEWTSTVPSRSGFGVEDHDRMGQRELNAQADHARRRRLVGHPEGQDGVIGTLREGRRAHGDVGRGDAAPQADDGHDAEDEYREFGAHVPDGISSEGRSEGAGHCTLSTKLTSGWLNSDTWICSVMSQVPTMGGFGRVPTARSARPRPSSCRSRSGPRSGTGRLR